MRRGRPTDTAGPGAGAEPGGSAEPGAGGASGGGAADVLPVSLDGYDVLESIGAGGYSRVYRAWQHDVERTVAVKVLSGSLASEADRRSFERECRAMGALSGHPNIVTVYNAAYTADGRPCLVMAHYAGGTLGDRVKAHGPIAPEELLTIGIRICGALATAHERGVIHRDIKPQNLFVSEFGEPALGDFGISTFDGDRTVTGAGGGLTVHYAPPEIVEGEAATTASDVYSLAATLYALATGRRPFPRGENETITDLARRILFEPAPRLGSEWGSVADVIARAMAKDPRERPAGAEQLGEALQAAQIGLGLAPTPLPIASGSSPPAPPARRAEHDRSVEASVSTTVPPPPAQTAEDSNHGGPDVARRPPPVGAIDRLSRLVGSRRVRAWLLAAAACLVVAAVGVALERTDRADVEAGPSTTRPGPSTSDGFFAAPERPRGVELAIVGSMMIISWEEARGAASYQVLRTDRLDLAGIEVAGVETELTLEEDARPCVEVISVGVDGKLSPPSERVCG